MTKQITMAFDIDNTLIKKDWKSRDIPNYDIIAILRYFQASGAKIILWSGSGVDYAETWGEKLGLRPFQVLPKGSEKVDIAFDDQEVALGEVNIQV